MLLPATPRVDPLLDGEFGEEAAESSMVAGMMRADAV